MPDAAAGSVEIYWNGQTESEVGKIKLMPKEFGEQRAIEPVYYASREERIKFAQDLVESGKVTVKLTEEFSGPEIKNDILAAVLTNVWMLPSASLGNELPIQASTAHKASSTSLVIDMSLPDTIGRVDIVAKPIPNPLNAESEIRLLRKCQQRGIKVIEPVGVILVHDEDGNRGYSLTMLKHGIVPLSTLRLEGIRLTGNDDKVKSLLRNLGVFVADFQNKGLSHGDLHPGNIGFDATIGSSENFILFDLERAHLLEQNKLAFKKNGNNHQGHDFRNFELAYLKDLAKITAFMAVYNREGLDSNTIKSEIRSGYFSHRNKEKGQLTDEEFNEKFETFYQKFSSDAEVSLRKTRVERKPTT